MQIELDTGEPLIARTALMVYTNASATQGLVMQHALSTDGESVVLAEGTPVTTDLIRQLRELNATQSLQYVPPGVVAQGVRSLAWVEERAPRALLFQGAHDPAVAALDGQILPQPRLLFIVKAGQLFLYALRGHERPDLGTRLYRAPFFNIFSNHAMCVGSVKLPVDVTPNDIPRWTEAFYLSNFVKPADSQRRWNFAGTYRELWDAACAAGTFHDEWLVDAGLTLAQAMGGSACTA